MIIATMPATGTGTIEVGPISVTHRTPTLALCRALLAAGYEDQPMTVMRGGRAAIHVASIAAAAGMTVIENEKIGPRFAKFRPFEMDTKQSSDIDARGRGVDQGEG